jgi:hypothetical protein
MTMKHIQFTIGFFLCVFHMFSQDDANTSFTKENNLTIDTHKATLKISDLETNGISTYGLTAMKESDIEKIMNFDFTSYRLYSGNQKVQIENGPVIEIYSLEKMISNGKTFSEELIFSKKNADYSNVTHAIIPKVNVGFGLTEAEVFH